MAYKVKMDRVRRATQLMPFSARKGYDEALRVMESPKVSRKELCEDRLEMLDRVLWELREGDKITVVYFRRGEYEHRNGIFYKVDYSSRYLKVDEKRIPIDDICYIERIPEELS